MDSRYLKIQCYILAYLFKVKTQLGILNKTLFYLRMSVFYINHTVSRFIFTFYWQKSDKWSSML